MCYKTNKDKLQPGFGDCLGPRKPRSVGWKVNLASELPRVVTRDQTLMSGLLAMSNVSGTK
jgi:hypothetical protein